MARAAQPQAQSRCRPCFRLGPISAPTCALPSSPPCPCPCPCDVPNLCKRRPYPGPDPAVVPTLSLCQPCDCSHPALVPTLPLFFVQPMQNLAPFGLNPALVPNLPNLCKIRPRLVSTLPSSRTCPFANLVLVPSSRLPSMHRSDRPPLRLASGSNGERTASCCSCRPPRGLGLAGSGFSWRARTRLMSSR